MIATMPKDSDSAFTSLKVIRIVFLYELFPFCDTVLYQQIAVFRLLMYINVISKDSDPALYKSEVLI